MNVNELQQELRAQARHLRARSTPLNHIVPLMQRSADFIQQQQAEIERLTTKNLEWLANWNEQQAEIEALKKQCANYEILIASWGKE